MITILYSIVSWFGLLIILSVLLLLISWMWGNITGDVPFVGAPIQTLKEIEKAMDIKDTSVVYDLGCGDGRVLFHLRKNNPNAKYVGIENSLFPYILANFNNWLLKIKKEKGIKIIRGNFFGTDISDATHVFTYLYPNIMDDLLPKFDKELKNGTRLVSASFHFTAKKGVQEVDLKRNGYKIVKKLYIYEF